MFQNVMVPCDGSKNSFKAADTAIEIAKNFKSKVTAIYVIDENTAFPYETLEDEGNAILAKITEKGQKEEVIVIEHLITGDPLRDMKIIAEKSQVDSIVISTHGKNNSELLVGSVADRIIKTFDIPIVLIK